MDSIIKNYGAERTTLAKPNFWLAIPISLLILAVLMGLVFIGDLPQYLPDDRVKKADDEAAVIPINENRSMQEIRQCFLQAKENYLNCWMEKCKLRNKVGKCKLSAKSASGCNAGFDNDYASCMIRTNTF